MNFHHLFLNLALASLVFFASRSMEHSAQKSFYFALPNLILGLIFLFQKP
jgi:hypothetical protein